MVSDIDVARAYYAEELRAVANLQSEALVRAFAKVPPRTFSRATTVADPQPRSRVLLDNQRHAGGSVLKVDRKETGFAARFISHVGVFPCIGARDPNLNAQLRHTFLKGNRKSVQSLRRDTHEPMDNCWFHGETFCLSKLPVE